MGSHYEASIRRPLVAGEKSYHDVTVDIAKPIETKANIDMRIAATFTAILRPSLVPLVMASIEPA